MSLADCEAPCGRPAVYTVSLRVCTHSNMQCVNGHASGARVLRDQAGIANTDSWASLRVRVARYIVSQYYLHFN